MFAPCVCVTSSKFAFQMIAMIMYSGGYDYSNYIHYIQCPGILKSTPLQQVIFALSK